MDQVRIMRFLTMEQAEGKKKKGDEKGDDERGHGDIGTPQRWEAGIQTKPDGKMAVGVSTHIKKQRQRDEGKGER